MTGTRPVLRVEHLHVRRGTTILKDINWRVERGQHWGILGANGSGKTTLLNALTGYSPATAGRVEVRGQEFGKYDWRELRKQIGLVSHHITQMMDRPLTARETVLSGKEAMLNYAVKGSTEDEAKSWRILRQVQCEHLAERSWLTLSQGERQRVAIGRSIMADFQLLLLDEPCAGLDPVAREGFLAFVERLARGKTSPTLVLVTHHTDEIMPSFTHVLVLKSGRVLASGEKRQILTSSVLSDAFDTPATLVTSDSRYVMRISRNGLIFSSPDRPLENDETGGDGI